MEEIDRILIEADFLVNLFEGNASREAIETAYRQMFETGTGKRLMREMFDFMKYYLSRPLGPEKTMVWPGAETPVLAPAATLEADGFRETELKFLSHTGTHMDAPAHMLKDGATLEDIPVEQFFGRARVMDCRNFGPGSRIEASDLPPLEDIDFLLLATGWEEKWGSPAYFGPFPVLSRAASEKLCRQRPEGRGGGRHERGPHGFPGISRAQSIIGRRHGDSGESGGAGPAAGAERWN